MRCRIPWLSEAHVYPHERSTAAYPEPLSNELIRTSLNELQAHTAQLYVLANIILSVDVECCRQGWGGAALGQHAEAGLAYGHPAPG